MLLLAVPTWIIALGIFVAMLVGNELGFRLGRRSRESMSDISHSVSNALKGSVFALVALLLGFSFSATTSRYDLRLRVTLDQANAIGTLYLRAGLLDAWHAQRIRDVLRDYLDARLELQSTSNSEQSRLLNERINRQMAALWSEVEATGNADLQRLHMSQVLPAANDVIDLSATRAWAAHNRLPSSVLMVLLTSVVVSAVLLGHSSGQAGVRHFGLWLSANIICMLVMFVIIDFDRPRRGLIQVDSGPLEELRESISIKRLEMGE